MERIVNRSMRFDQFFTTNSLCGPSRATFMTGLYSHAHGVMTNDSIAGLSHDMKSGQPTFASVLRQEGYHTMVIGKWHIPSLPEGYSDFNVLSDHPRHPVPGQGIYFNPTFISPGGKLRSYSGHADDVIGDLAVAALRNRNKSQPFCLQVHSKTAHADWFPPERYRKARRQPHSPPCWTLQMPRGRNFRRLSP